MTKIIKKKSIGKNRIVVILKQRNKYSPGGDEYVLFGRKKIEGKWYESEGYYYRGSNGYNEALNNYREIKTAVDFDVVKFPALRR